jgi:hypothetical protein
MKVRSVGVRRVWDCMLCACVSEEGEDGEGAGSETPSLLNTVSMMVSSNGKAKKKMVREFWLVVFREFMLRGHGR